MGKERLKEGESWLRKGALRLLREERSLRLRIISSDRGR